MAYEAKMKEYYWNELPPTKHQFFKIMMGDYSTVFKMPRKFMENFRGDLSAECVTLFGPSGNKWKTKLRMEGDDHLLTKGWDKFVQDHKIQDMNFLVFQYVGDSSFRVYIFDQSACENEDAYYIKTSQRQSDDGRSFMPRKLKIEIQQDGMASPATSWSNGVPDDCNDNDKNDMALEGENMNSSGGDLLAEEKKVEKMKGKQIVDEDGESGDSISVSSENGEEHAYDDADAQEIMMGHGSFSTEEKKVKTVEKMKGKGIMTDDESEDTSFVSSDEEDFSDDDSLSSGPKYKTPAARLIKTEPAGSCDMSVDDDVDLKYPIYFKSNRREVTDEEIHNTYQRANMHMTDDGRPHFLMTMKPSYVARLFRATIPRKWARAYLPKSEVLELRVGFPPNQRKWQLSYEAHPIQYTLGGGWREFVQDNKLEEHDVCVFELAREKNKKAGFARNSILDVIIFRVVEEVVPATFIRSREVVKKKEVF